MSTASDLKVQIEKLDGSEDWPKWKWQIPMLLRAHCLEGITNGSRKCPVLPADSQPQQTKELTEGQQDDAKAASIFACALSKSVAELVLTCTSAKDIWDKLCARFERSSTQRLNMLIESFFQVQRDCKEDISTHVAKLQKLFADINDELAKHNENTLSERMLTGRILSTLCRKERIIRVQYGRQRNCHLPQGYFRDNTGSDMSRKCVCSRRQLWWGKHCCKGTEGGVVGGEGGGRNSTYSEVRKVNL